MEHVGRPENKVGQMKIRPVGGAADPPRRNDGGSASLDPPYIIIRYRLPEAPATQRRPSETSSGLKALAHTAGGTAVSDS